MRSVHHERPGATTVAVLQEALAAQHAAVHVLGHLGGVVSTSVQPELASLLRERHQWHRALRDQMVVAVRNAGATPTAAAPVYELPDSGDPAAVRAAALAVEERCAQTYAALVGASAGELRTTALEALVGQARVLVTWGAGPEAFPGAPELS